MFSRLDILGAIKAGDLKIIPFNAKDLKPDAILLHLDGEIAVAKKGRIDPQKTSDFKKFYKKTQIQSGFELKPGAFVLCRTSERLSLSNKIVMFIEGRSTLARMGLSVTQTAMVVHAGHGIPIPRKVVLEIHNSGPFSVVLRRGMPIAKGAFLRLDTPTDVLYDAVGKYGKKRDLDDLLPVRE